MGNKMPFGVIDPDGGGGLPGADTSKAVDLDNPSQSKHESFNEQVNRIQQSAFDGLSANDATLTGLTRQFNEQIESASSFRGQVAQAASDLEHTSAHTSRRPIPDLREGEMTIGAVKLIVPPEKVQVQEIPQNLEVPGIRTDGSTIIKTGKGRIQIGLDLVFNGKQDINRNLRKLIAQFRTLPYVPVVSPYLARIVQPLIGTEKTNKHKEELDKAINTVTTRVAATKQEIERRFEGSLAKEAATVAEATKSDVDSIFNAANVQAARSAFNNETENISELENKLREYVRVLGVEVARTTAVERKLLLQAGLFAEEARVFSELVDRMKYDMLQLHQLRSQRTQLELGGITGLQKGVVPCCLDQLFVRPEPGNAHLLRVQLVLIYFNPVPYGGTLAYNDLYGRATVNPDEAFYYNRHLKKAWLDKRLARGRGNLPKEGEDFKRRQPIRGLGLITGTGGDDDLTIAHGTITLSHEELRKITNKFEKQSKGNNKQITIADVLQQYSPKTEWLRFDQPGVVIRHVSIGIGNRLAMQPIPGEVYGSAQYIGANPGRVTIALDTTNPSFVEQFHRMKMMNQRLTVTPIRAWRRTEVHIASPVINMAGIYTCQIDDITTESVTPNTTRITLRLLEHRIDLTKREQVTRASLFSKTVIKRVLRYLVNIARDYLERRVIKLKTTQPEALDRLQVQRQRLGLKELTATQIQQRFEERIPDYKRQAFQILYGDRGLQIAELDIAATEFGSYADAIRARPELNFVRYTHGAVITQDLIRHAYLLETGNRAVQEGGIFTSIVDFFFGTPDTARPRNEDSAAVDARTRLKNEVLKLHYGTDINISPQSTLLSPDRAAAVEADERRRQFAGRDKLPSTAKAQAEGIYQRYTDYRIVQPTELEIDLLAEFMFRGAANATDEVAVDDSGVTTFKTSAGEASDIQSMLNLATAVFQNKVKPESGPSIQDIAFGKGQTFRDFLEDRKQEYSSLLYPDMELPTYREVLEPLIDAVKTRRNDPDFELTDFNKLRADEKPLFRKFVPRLRNLGQIPKNGQPISNFAYEPSDVVSPEVFFFRPQTNVLDSAIDKAVGEEMRGYTLKRTRNPETEHLTGFWGAEEVPHDPLRAEVFRKAFTEGPNNARPAVTKRKDGTAPSLGKMPTDFLITESYKAGRARSNIQDFGPETPETMRNIFKAAYATREETALGLSHAFPTFRLFFVEEDSNEGNYRLIDDVYGFNSVVEAHVTRHKYQPDLCELVLTNLTGTLEYDRFSTAWGGKTERALGTDARATGGITDEPETPQPREPRTNEKPQRDFPLNEGTRIVLQMGYSSRADFIHTVFTGKIAEVTMGDVVRIVAQGYLQELLYPVAGKTTTEASGLIIEQMMTAPSVEHFGRWTPYSWMRLSAAELENARSTNYLTTWDGRFSAFFAEPKLRNVFTAKYSNWWSKTFRTTFHEDWDLGDGSKTAWDIIQEVTNFSPGWIAAVVPFDLEATLFVGRPEQMFFWTDGRRREERNWLQARARSQRRQVMNLGRALLRQFKTSRFYDNHTSLDNVGRLVQSEFKSGLFKVNAVSDLDQGVGTILVRLGQKFPRWTLLIERITRGGRAGALPAGFNIRLGEVSPTFVGMLNELENTRLGPILGELNDILDEPESHTIAGIMIESLDVGTLDDLRMEKMRRTIAGPGNVRLEVTPDLEEAERTRSQLLNQNFAGIKALETAEGEGLVNIQQRIPNFQAVRVGSMLSEIEDLFPFLSSIWDGDHAGAGDSDTDPLYAKIVKEIELRQNIWLTKAYTANDLNGLARWLWLHAASVPVFFKALLAFLREDPLVSFGVKALEETDKYPGNPRMKPFRSYHMVTSTDDIIENQIAATRSAMWNGVGIGSGSRPLVVWADDGLFRGDRILRYFNEPNADRDIRNVTNENNPTGLVDNKYHVMATRMAQGIRFMYRGQLVCRGRADIKPWDIVYVYDHYNMITGPIEVERITHHFSAQTGFVSTITPHAVAVPNNQIDTTNIMLQGLWTSFKYGALGVVLPAIGGAVLGFFLGGPIGAIVGGFSAGLAGKTVVDSILTETTGTDLWGNFIGVGRHGGLRMPVKIVPLQRQGVPWTAALRGFGNGRQDDWGFVFERFRKKALDADKAGKLLWNAWWDGFDSYRQSVQADTRYLSQTGRLRG